jgi:stress responsive alpha/beta barrel protein
MIRHIHFNRWKPEATAEQIDKVFEALADFPERFPEIKTMGLHRDAGMKFEGVNLKNYDFAIILDFDDEAKLRQYLDREHHKKMVQTYIAPIRAESARIQIVVD